MYIKSNITTWRQSGAEHDPKPYQSPQKTCTLSQPISPPRFAWRPRVKQSRAAACVARNEDIQKAKLQHLRQRGSRPMVGEGQAVPTPCTRHADANVHATALPFTLQPGQARTSTVNKVDRHLQSPNHGRLDKPSTSWHCRSSNGLRTRQACSQRRRDARVSVAST